MPVMDVKTADINVGCLGVFTVTVCDDEYWEVRLVHKNGDIFYRSRGTMLPDNIMMNYATFEKLELPQWMWECIRSKIAELTIKFERDSLVTPDCGMGISI